MDCYVLISPWVSGCGTSGIATGAEVGKGVDCCGTSSAALFKLFRLASRGGTTEMVGVADMVENMGFCKTTSATSSLVPIPGSSRDSVAETAGN